MGIEVTAFVDSHERWIIVHGTDEELVRVLFELARRSADATDLIGDDLRHKPPYEDNYVPTGGLRFTIWRE